MVLRRKADMPENFVGEFTEHADDAWITANGARMVARAWTDPEYRTRMVRARLRRRLDQGNGTTYEATFPINRPIIAK